MCREAELTPLEMLKRARKRLSSESAWCKGSYTKDGRMCIVGACDGMYTQPSVKDLIHQSIRILYPHQFRADSTVVRCDNVESV